LRYKAGAGGRPGVFPRPGGGRAGPDDAGVGTPEAALAGAPLIQVPRQGVGDLGPGAALAPAVGAAVGGLPPAMALGGVGPGGAGGRVPEGAVDRRPVVV